MNQAQASKTNSEPQTEDLPRYDSILLAADSSDHSNQATRDAVAIAKLWNGEISGAHVYAAKLHDIRFRQMEGGLPEQFRQEDELERQRDVHDDLITRGLSIITDSYLDQIDRICEQENISFKRRSLEGKNYRELTRETNKGEYDLLILGAQGLGAVKDSVLGTVCERVSRRSCCDTLVVKNPKQKISEGPIVVAIDGSAYAYGGLLRGIALAKRWDVPLQVISAFDPYYHYVAFNRIASVLSEEAGKIFRFQEQEQLHEEIIDSGLAKIYDGHLAIARDIAEEHDIKITTTLLDGKPWEAILKYLKQSQPSLLIMGKTGIHADEELDIGGNSEAVLRLANCAVLLTHFEHQPQIERLADVTTSWTVEAEERMKNVPSFVQNMARGAILRYAQERGHTVITESIVEQATKQLMPGHAEQAIEEIVTAYDAGELKRSVTPKPMSWSEPAREHLNTIDDESLRNNLAMRAEKKARGAGLYMVEIEHIFAFTDAPATEFHWRAAALARLSRVPEGFMRDTSRQRIEDYARQNSLNEITLDTAEAGLAQSRDAMQQIMQEQNSDSADKKQSICPFARAAEAKKSTAERAQQRPGETEESQPLEWTADAERKMQSVPPGYCRDMTRKAAESIAEKSGDLVIDSVFLEQVLNTFTQGSGEVEETLSWDEDAQLRIAKAPDMVRGMLVQEIETWVKERGEKHVDHTAVDAAKSRWEQQGVFHLAANDPRNL
jgi:nucleotide-binding universal stress UspA family protein